MAIRQGEEVDSALAEIHVIETSAMTLPTLDGAVDKIGVPGRGSMGETEEYRRRHHGTAQDRLIIRCVEDRLTEDEAEETVRSSNEAGASTPTIVIRTVLGVAHGIVTGTGGAAMNTTAT